MVRILLLFVFAFVLLPLNAQQEEINLALGKKVSASSHRGTNLPKLGTDGNRNTKWESAPSDPQWFTVDLDKEETVGRIVIFWENSYAKEYKIQVSNDGKLWEEAYFTKKGAGKKETIRFTPRKVRYVRLTADQRSAWGGYSFSEMRIFAK